MLRLSYFLRLASRASKSSISETFGSAGGGGAKSGRVGIPPSVESGIGPTEGYIKSTSLLEYMEGEGPPMV